MWQTDDELFDLMRRELFTAVVGDALDKLGYEHQFLPPRLRPLAPHMVVLGRAMTVLEADIDVAIRLEDEREELRQPFGLMFRALDDLRRHEVYVCSGASPCYALWGELMSIRAQQCGATGAVVDGYSRDTHGILKLAFPVFSTGSYAQDQGPRGKVIDFRCGLEIEGVRIADGDILFGDIDGVLVIPHAIERDCLTAALAKVRSENLVRAALLTGMTTAEAFQRFGVM